LGKRGALSRQVTQRKEEATVPVFQEVSERLNYRFNRLNIGDVQKSQFGPGELLDMFEEQGLITSPQASEFIKTIPDSIKAAIRAVYASAVNRESQVPVTIAWMPGYDYEVTVSESAGTADSIGGITILVRTRYPGDPHPSRRGRRNGGAESTSA
jgi:hypothetical protein